jgi:uncharacterized protein YaiL (DUF2058 family)
MSNSLKDQLLGLGFKTVPEPPRQAKPADPRPQGGRPAPQARPHGGKPSPQARPHGGRPVPPSRPQPGRGAPQGKPRADFDLGKAYALRAQKEKNERIAAEQAKQEEARLRREARAKLTALLEGKALNDATAEHVRHFEYGGKIKRVHVTPEQLVKLNAGELGVLQSEGRYLLVTAEVLAQAKEIFAPAVALEVDPNAPALADDYADPKFQVPDDLNW